MKTKIFAIMCIILLLVCLVACNNRDPNGDLVTTGRKPFAKPDPNNPYDKKGDKQNMYIDWDRWADNGLGISFTNTESLNNLFHDFVPEDFPGLDIVKVWEILPRQLDEARTIYAKENKTEQDNKVLSRYIRHIGVEFNFHDYEQLATIYEMLWQRQEIKYLEPFSETLWFAEPNDTNYQISQHAFAELIGLEEAWDHTTGSSSVKIGVLDSGVLGTHTDLSDNFDSSLSEAYGYYQNPLIDVADHGTSVAGIIGAVGNNNTGISGICWDVTLISLKISSRLGDPGVEVAFGEDPYAFAAALAEVNDKGISILSFSGGWITNHSFVRDAIEEYSGLLICAAGNSNIDMDASGTTKVYPACYTYSNILTVGASTMADAKYGPSNYGATSVDIFAPGVGIYTTNSSGGYGGFSYTSAATPVVAGIAGLLLSYEPTLTTAEIKSAIINTAEQSSELIGKCVSGGRVNAWKAIEYFRKNYRYTNNGARSNHTCKCTICNYSYTEAHVWNSGLMGYSCHYCLAISKFVEVVIPKINKRYQLLLQQAALMSDNPDFYYVNIDEHSALVYDNGKYYLVYESDEQGLPKYQISTDFLAYGYTIVGNQIVRTSEIETPPIYEPVVKTA